MVALARSTGSMSNASLTFAWSCTEWYWVVVPSSHHGWLERLSPYTAPVTGTSVATGGTPVDRSRVANTSGWPSLSSRFRSIHHDQAPARSPSDALACQPL